MALRGKAPEIVSKKFKAFWFGDSGVGKTILALQFPNSYIIDTEHGTDQYSEMIAKNNSAVLYTNDIDEIKSELKSLATERHEYSTFILDGITGVYNSCQDKWNAKFSKYAKNEKESDMQDFGFRFWNKVKSDFKSMHNAILRLDMNVIITSHEKTEYVVNGNQMTKIGVTYESMRDDKYIYDLVFRMVKNGNNERLMQTIKERSEIDKRRFPDEFVASYDNFHKFYGSALTEKAKPLELASIEQSDEIKLLLDTVKIEEDWLDKVLNKANVDKVEDLTKEQADKTIKFLRDKLPK